VKIFVTKTNSNSNSTIHLPTQKVTLGKTHPDPIEAKEDELAPREEPAAAPRVPVELRRLADYNNISGTASASPTKRTSKQRELLTYNTQTTEPPAPIYAPGTIIRKRFEDGKWLEGEGNKDGKLFNGPIMVLAKIIKNVMSSAAEAEVAALFMNAQEMAPMRQCLKDLGHAQPATPIKTDNSTATGIINNTIKQKRSKSIDMRFYWLLDRVKQGQF
jgi:hypothetical protein